MNCVCSIGRPKHVRVMAGALEGDTFVGPEAEVFRFKFDWLFATAVTRGITISINYFFSVIYLAEYGARRNTPRWSAPNTVGALYSVESTEANAAKVSCSRTQQIDPVMYSTLNLWLKSLLLYCPAFVGHLLFSF